MEENPLAGVLNEDSDGEIEYDEDGNPIPPPKNKIIDPLPPIDHSEITYKDFEKNFYAIHPDIAALSNNQVAELRNTLGIKVRLFHDFIEIYLTFLIGYRSIATTSCCQFCSFRV